MSLDEKCHVTAVYIPIEYRRQHDVKNAIELSAFFKRQGTKHFGPRQNKTLINDLSRFVTNCQHKFFGLLKSFTRPSMELNNPTNLRWQSETNLLSNNGITNYRALKHHFNKGDFN